MSRTGSGDFFDRARAFSAAVLLAAGAAAIIGAFLDWVSIEPPDVVPPAQEDRLAGFTGIETVDGRVILGGGVVLVASAILLALRRKALYGWIAFLVSMLIGAIAIADYRDITGLFYDEMHRIGDPTPMFGLGLCATAGIVGLLGSLVGITATPAERSSG